MHVTNFFPSACMIMHIHRQLMAKEDFKRLGYKDITEAESDNTDSDSKEQNDSTKT